MRITRHRLKALAAPARRWGVAVVLAAATFAAVHSSVRRAEAARAGWGQHRTVLVAVHDVPAGAALDAGSVRATRWPRALAADDALAPGDERGAVTGIAVLAGEPLRRAHLRAGGLRVPVGTRAVAVRAVVGLVLVAGDHVDVIDADSGALVAHAATVVAVDADATTVAVAPEEAPPVAAAASRDRVALAVTGDG